ncbi:hypothetical protein AAHC03_027088 [Spirometra sp. Aus1]
MALAPKLALFRHPVLRKWCVLLTASLSKGQSFKEPVSKDSLAKSTQSASQLPSTSLKQRVSQSAADAGYTTVIIGGIALTGVIFYVIGNELFSKKSPTRVYEDALKLCANDQRVQDLLGSSITGCGEANRRGRRTRVASSSWSDKEGRQHMTMRFFLKGPVASGTAHLEVYENDKKEFEYRYLVVEVDGLVKRQVILRPETTTAED